MTNFELVNELADSLDEMIDWAREVSDEYIDGSDLRSQYRESLANAKFALKEARAYISAAGDQS